MLSMQLVQCLDLVRGGRHDLFQAPGDHLIQQTSIHNQL